MESRSSTLRNIGRRLMKSPRNPIVKIENFKALADAEIGPGEGKKLLKITAVASLILPTALLTSFVMDTNTFLGAFLRVGGLIGTAAEGFALLPELLDDGKELKAETDEARSNPTLPGFHPSQFTHSTQ